MRTETSAARVRARLELVAALRGAEHRIEMAEKIIGLPRALGAEAFAAMSVADMANLIGASRESTAHVLLDMTIRGILEIAGRAGDAARGRAIYRLGPRLREVLE